MKVRAWVTKYQRHTHTEREREREREREKVVDEEEIGICLPTVAVIAVHKHRIPVAEKVMNHFTKPHCNQDAQTRT